MKNIPYEIDIEGLYKRSNNIPGVGFTVLSGTLLYDYAKIEDKATVGNTDLQDSAVVGGEAQVYHSIIKGNARVSGNAVLQNCVVADEAQIYGDASLRNISVTGRSAIFGNAKLGNGEYMNIYVIIAGSCKFGGNANFKGLKGFEDFVKKYGADKVTTDIIDRQFTMRQVTLTDVWDMG